MKEHKMNKSKKSTQQKVIHLQEGDTVKQLIDKLDIKGRDFLEKLASDGLDVSVNDIVDEYLSQKISQSFNLKIKISTIEEEMKAQAEKDPQQMVTRPPVVAMLGHVDHGKTTLLDAIRQSNLVRKESGGITQHVGAYRISYKDKPITFIDTPGHEAFTQLRSRGAQITDIVILVVAADDGVMPQTKEAINHARAAGVPIMVAINKIDKEGVDLDKVKQQLSKEGLLIEDWGGDTVSVEVSATKKKNLNELLEMILLLSEMEEFKANPNIKAQGVILESRLDTKKGPLATVIVQHGILHRGDPFISNITYGKAKALFDENSKTLKRADASMPVEILGFTDVPTAGDIFQVVSDLETAKKISDFRKSQLQKEKGPRPERMTLDQLFQKMEEGEVKELRLVIKADVQGSVEVLNDLLPNLGSDQVKINILHSATGKITESDVLLASASDAIIIGYNTRANQKIQDMASNENVEIRTYKVIYKLTEDIKKALKGMLEPTVKETYLGEAEVRQIFRISRVGTVAGCYVRNGKISRNAKIKVSRNGEIIHEGQISSLKHFKENVTEITKNHECGISLEKFKDIQEGDLIRAYLTEKEKLE
ncbi:translation initiation factor IF-2 [bacterium]|nr:translation initiation factor IF-2 [bacterium]